MPPTLSRTSAEPTLYEILSLTQKRLEGQASAAQQKAIKQGYHKALLKHHPDKNPQDSSTTSPKPQPKSSSSSGGKSSSSQLTYTVDQIQHAYTVLSDARQRREYDRQLLLTSASSAATEQKHSVSTRFHTGVETVDLDDLGFDERTAVYFGSCRCGNARGFQFTEAQLEEHEEDLVLMVQCLDCSLWMRVLFDAAEESGDDQPQQQQQSSSFSISINPSSTPAQRPGNGTANAAAGQTAMAGHSQSQAAAERRGGGSVSRSGKGWNFNVSFDWGISLSGSGSATTSASQNGRT
ncbi:hypothetical protein GGS24DRAFT_153569 [Hypoxylon argillaceum]|nr:hypothetical protein GGS24DRAFT_153569 [Hypoxylon argillaceum]